MNPLDLLVGLRQADYADTLAEVEGKADLILMSPPYDDCRGEIRISTPGNPPSERS